MLSQEFESSWWLQTTIPATPLLAPASNAQPGGFSLHEFLCYINYMDKSHEIAVAIDQWISEVDRADIEPDEILATFNALCVEFSIPDDIGKRAVARALGEDID